MIYKDKILTPFVNEEVAPEPPPEKKTPPEKEEEEIE